MICQGCGGIVGRDCYNPQECLWISQQQQNDQETESQSWQSGYDAGYKAALSKGNWTDEDLHLIKNRLIDILPTGMNLTAFDFVRAINRFIQEDWSEYLQSLKAKTTT